MNKRLEEGLPPIILSEEDFDALDRLVGETSSGAAALLRQELDRAEVREAADVPKNLVTLNRWIQYSDGRGAEPRRVQLVVPREADIDAGRISVLSHVGAGLLGLKEGESIDWPDPSGAERKLTVVRIEGDAEVA